MTTKQTLSADLAASEAVYISALADYKAALADYKAANANLDAASAAYDAMLFRVFYMPVGPLPTWLGDFATVALAQAALDEARQNFLNFRKEENS